MIEIGVEAGEGVKLEYGWNGSSEAHSENLEMDRIHSRDDWYVLTEGIVSRGLESRESMMTFECWRKTNI